MKDRVKEYVIAALQNPEFMVNVAKRYAGGSIGFPVSAVASAVADLERALNSTLQDEEPQSPGSPA